MCFSSFLLTEISIINSYCNPQCGMIKFKINPIYYVTVESLYNFNCLQTTDGNQMSQPRISTAPGLVMAQRGSTATLLCPAYGQPPPHIT